ncbi:MAG TPA: zf-HC2 domain-containing protein [Frankiaceae bacterium]|nr:zf-HC2 domain-containing protein [Frankiaceae bacterium]
MSSLQAGHLGDLGAALVDDQLSPDTRDVALAHLASCPGCQLDVEQQRRLKARLRTLAEPALPLNLALRLNALKPAGLPAAAAGGPPPGGLSDGGRSDGLLPDDLLSEGSAALTFPIRDRSRTLSGRRGRLLAGAASLVLLGVGTAYAAGSDVQPTAPVGTTNTALTTGGTQAVTTSISAPLPLNDPAFDAMNAAFVP